MKGKIIGHAIDANTVELTGEGLSLMFEALIKEHGREVFESMMKSIGWEMVKTE